MPLPAIRSPEPELELTRPLCDAARTILTPESLKFLARLVARFTPELQTLLAAREEQQAKFDSGDLPSFDPATADIREQDWTVAPIPAQVSDRRTEITGPVNRKMVINALNSGAQVYMADFEDSTSPTWGNLLDGQVNLRDAVRRDIELTNEAGKHYRLNESTAILMVRPRGLHLPEQHIRYSGKPIPGCLMDFALFLFHNHKELAARGSRPYYYLPKLQDHREAAWWNDVISYAEQLLGMEHGTVKVTVLIETLPAVFQMHEILHALKDRILGLNCGRWDYIFSYIKTLRQHPDRILPDRDQVVMTVPFLRAYSQLLIQTCHRRGAFAMGGMAAQIPIRGDEQANAMAMEKVRKDKEREAGNGHDGTWVAHPALEPMARAEFDKVLSGPNQIDRPISDEVISAEDLLSPSEGEITESGIRNNIRVAILYLAAWLDGNGCVPIDNLMEDAATAEIGRAQIWQWAQHSAQTDEGKVIDRTYIDQLFVSEHQKLMTDEMTDHAAAITRATALLREMSQRDTLEDFLTLPAYRELAA